MKWIDDIKENIGFNLATSGMNPEDRPDGNALMEDFLARCRLLDRPRVLELGTKRSIPTRSTRHETFVPHAAEYLGTDLEAGLDVDIVADLHCLTKATGEEQFDVIISCSTFEHLKYPHLAAHEVMKALKINGLLFIQTHQSFPLHAYPFDYFRFSREALAGLFGTRMGFNVIATDYEFPVRHYTPRERGLHRCEAYLNVRLLGIKTGPTPADYIYEL